MSTSGKENQRSRLPNSPKPIFLTVLPALLPSLELTSGIQAAQNKITRLGANEGRGTKLNPRKIKLAGVCVLCDAEHRFSWTSEILLTFQGKRKRRTEWGPRALHSNPNTAAPLFLCLNRTPLNFYRGKRIPPALVIENVVIGWQVLH